MRIAFVGAVPPIGGGIAQNSGNLVLALRRAGHDVRVASWAAQYPHILFPGASQIREDVEPLEGATFSLRWWDPTGWARVGRRARAADLLVFPWVTPFQGPALSTVARAAGHMTVVAMIHNSRPHEYVPFSEPLTRLGLRRAARFVAHAPQVLGELASLGLDQPGTVVPHPPNVSIEPCPMPPRGPLRLVFLGFVRHYKGVDLAIRTVARLRDCGVDARLTIAGEAWGNAGSLHHLARELRVEDRVDFDLRYVGDDEISTILGRHHVVVLPYRTATQSGIVPLAQAAGRPVVATEVGGLAAQVRDGITGRLVPVGDVPALAEAVREIATDLVVYGERSRSVAPTWDAVAAAIVGSRSRACGGESAGR